MKINRHLKAALLAMVGLALAAPHGMSQATSYTNSFDNSASVASWIYQYGLYQPATSNNYFNNMAMSWSSTNDDTPSIPGSGSLEVLIPWSVGSPYDQVVMFGTFDNKYGYDQTTVIDGTKYTNIIFDVYVDGGSPVNQNTNYGTLNVGFEIAPPQGWGSKTWGASAVTLPLSASNAWHHVVVPIDITTANINNSGGINFDINTYSGGSLQSSTNPTHFYIDNLVVEANPGPPPLPPTLFGLRAPIPGLNCIDVDPGSGSVDNRYHIATTNHTGYGFVDKPNVTYSWTITSFPTNELGGFQQHLFFVNGTPGQYDQAADYNLADCIFLTVQQATQTTLTTNGSIITTNITTNGVFNFRYKTNLPSGNGMLFNTYAPTVSNSLPTYTTNTNTMVVTTNAAVNPNFWPVMPVCQLYAPTVLGTWSINFSNTNNVTMYGPGGVSTNFVFDSASAALFADPMTLLLGAQPNNTNGYGQSVVYSSFSITGNDTPFTDNFATDPTLNTNIWKASLANDTNGVVLVPPTAAYWLDWTLPDGGFSLQTTGHLPSTNWTSLSPITILDNNHRQALIDSSTLPGTNQGYFSLVERSYSQLLVLFPGETFAPNTPTGGRTGTPTPVSGGSSAYAPTSVTVIAVDSSFNQVSGVNDTLTITSSDTAIVTPNTPPALVNGTVTFTVAFSQVETATVTATDPTTGFTGTSSSVSVTP